MVATDPAPVLGYWYSNCCAEDLYPIESEEELADVIASLSDDEDDGVRPRIWPTLADALADPSIAAQIARGDISDRTRERLLTPPGTGGGEGPSRST